MRSSEKWHLGSHLSQPGTCGGLGLARLPHTRRPSEASVHTTGTAAYTHYTVLIHARHTPCATCASTLRGVLRACALFLFFDSSLDYRALFSD